MQVYETFPLTELKRYVHLMENYANLIRNWANENSLTLNLSKTKAIIIGLYYYINLLTTSPIKGLILENTFIKFESSLRNLGAIFDSKLNWKEQVSSICNRVGRIFLILK